MNAHQSVLIALLFVIGVTQAIATEEYTPEELPQLVSDFELQHELFDDSGSPITNNTVDDVVLIRIRGTEPIVGAHDLVIYSDGRYVASQSEVRFPCEIRRSFRGLINGSHTMLLVFTNAEDEKGLVQLVLTVQH